MYMSIGGFSKFVDATNEQTNKHEALKRTKLLLRRDVFSTEICFATISFIKT
jgi:hypothetical protein